MELREIAAFIQVAQLKSFSKAAKQLGYSQAAVTIQIKQLEQELNVHLFDRIGKQTTLTHQGALFYEHAVSVMKENTPGTRSPMYQSLPEACVWGPLNPFAPPYSRSF
mgnify:CR=1 FL=1